MRKKYYHVAIPHPEAKIIKDFCKQLGEKPSVWLTRIGSKIATGEYIITPVSRKPEA